MPPHTSHRPMLSSPWASPCKGDWALARLYAPFIYKGVTTRNKDAHSNIIGMALPCFFLLISTLRVCSQKAHKKWGGGLTERQGWEKAGGKKEPHQVQDQINKIKGWRMGEGEGGVIDMTGRVGRGDKRCGSSILRVSSARQSRCSM